MPRPANPKPYKKTITRYRNAEGKEVKKGTPGARKHTEQSSTYYADVAGKTIALKTTDLAVAWRKLRQLLRRRHQEELGIRDRYSEHGERPLAEHLKEWGEVLRAKGTSAKQRGTIEGRLTNLFALAGWTRLGEISGDSALLALARLQEQIPARGMRRGRSAQTRNHYLTHLKGFCGWCLTSGRLRTNPVAGLDKINVESDQRHARRVPTREEAAYLLAYLEGDGVPERMGMSGPQRALGYQVAMTTGYRANEVRALTPDSFDLETGAVELPAREDKRRRADLHPLPAWLVERLRSWFTAGGSCWQGFPEDFPGRLLKADLAAARERWIAEAGEDRAEKRRRQESTFLAYQVETAHGPRFWDFHALRVWYCTELAAQPGIDVKTLMQLARHSTPTLTVGLYAKARPEHLRAATDRLQPPSPPPPPPPEG